MKVFVTGTVSPNTGSYVWFYNQSDWEKQCEEDSNFAEVYPNEGDDYIQHIKFTLETKANNRDGINREVETYWNEHY